MNKPLFTWDSEAGVATCTLIDKDKNEYMYEIFNYL